MMEPLILDAIAVALSCVSSGSSGSPRCATTPGAVAYAHRRVRRWRAKFVQRVTHASPRARTAASIGARCGAPPPPPPPPPPPLGGLAFIAAVALDGVNQPFNRRGIVKRPYDRRRQVGLDVDTAPGAIAAIEVSRLVTRSVLSFAAAGDSIWRRAAVSVAQH